MKQNYYMNNTGLLELHLTGLMLWLSLLTFPYEAWYVRFRIGKGGAPKSQPTHRQIWENKEQQKYYYNINDDNNLFRVSTAVYVFYLRSCCAEYHSPLLGWTKQLRTLGAWYISSKSQKHHNSFYQQTGQTDNKANPKCRLAKHTCPSWGLANKHQGTEKT